LQRRADHAAKLLQIDRLGEVVEGAALQRLDGVLGRAVGGDHDAALGALGLRHLAQQLQPQAVGQTHVGDDDVEALLSQLRTRLGQRAGRGHLVALTQQRQFVQGAQIGFVVHHQHARGAGCIR